MVNVILGMGINYRRGRWREGGRVDGKCYSRHGNKL